ncbi:hypothetical protein ACQUQP_16470 [Marinobacterium sp. YM272]
MSKAKSPISKADASRIQKSTSKKNGGRTPKDSFAARTQSAADKNAANVK